MPSTAVKDGGILTKTQNLIQLYNHWVGRSEIPAEYHLWACISMIAACVSDKVWVTKFRSNLTPNLYTFLIGPSGSGKGTAISAMLSLVDEDKVNYYNGRTTAQYMLDSMAFPTRDQKEKGIDSTKLFVLSPELAMSVGKGDQADTLIKIMTELYGGAGARTIKEGTRTRGGIEIENPCINWLAGTTVEWLKDCCTSDAMEGGFFARVVPVVGRYDFSRANRFVRPIFPPDQEIVKGYLKARISQLSTLNGEFALTDAAKELEEFWYHNRDEPEDSSMVPWWGRQHDLSLKLAMVFSLADSPTLVIERQHLGAAQRVIHSIGKNLPEIIRYTATTDDSKDIQVVLDIIKRNKRIGHSALLRRISYRGIHARQLIEIINTLRQANQIAVVLGPRKSNLYLSKNGANLTIPAKKKRGRPKSA